MAGIVKTYTDSYKDYKEFKDWANKQKLAFSDGYTICVGDWVWDYEEEDFDGSEMPIMNTPTWLDAYLIQNCKSVFVLDRLKSVYSEESYKEFQTVDLTSPPLGDFKQNRKITIKRNDRTRFPLHTKPYGGIKYWWLQCNDDFRYNSETNTWISPDSYYPWDTNTAHVTSVKALVRHLRKQYLPKGIIFRLIGSYIGEEYSVHIKN